jgi:hypothetical protein
MPDDGSNMVLVTLILTCVLALGYFLLKPQLLRPAAERSAR